MKKLVYPVTAYRWSDRENHSYFIGVYAKKAAALKAADKEEAYRGGKYGCEVLEVELDNGIEGKSDHAFKVIKAIEKRIPGDSLPKRRPDINPYDFSAVAEWTK